MKMAMAFDHIRRYAGESKLELKTRARVVASLHQKALRLHLARGWVTNLKLGD